MQTAHDLVRMAAARAPDGLALVDDRSKLELTYGELLAEIDAIAAGLAALGVSAGTRFATVLPNSIEHCLILLALQRLAAVPALINLRLKPEEIGELLAQGEIQGAAIRSDEALRECVAAALPRGAPLLDAGELEACRDDPSWLPLPKPDREDAAFIFYTSGTTGLPKGVVVAHRTSEPRVVWLSTMMGLRGCSGIRSLGCSPLTHAIGFHGVFLATLAFNGTFYTLTSFDPAKAIDLIERHSINYLFSLPTIYDAIVSAPEYRPERMRSLRTVFWGGATIEPALLDQLAREWPARLAHIYGTTETMCALCHLDPVGQHDVLKPAYSSRVQLGEQDELLIDATTDAIFSGYLNRPDVTAEKVRDGWYHTGDAARIDEEGNVRLLGRIDDLIRSGGESIQPDEVESVLGSHPEVIECAVVGAPDPRWGQRVVACVVARGGAIDTAELDRCCRSSRLADFKRPRSYAFVDTLPRGPGGKLLRRVLRERLGELVLHPASNG